MDHCDLEGKRETMNFRRLQYFVKIVDIGSLTQAAEILHVAQPALSQQLATLEGEVSQQLLTRTKRGVVPNGGGQDPLSPRAGDPPAMRAGARRHQRCWPQHHRRGLARPRARHGSATLALPLLRAVRIRLPGIVLYLNETTA